MQAQIDTLNNQIPPRSVRWVNSDSIHLTLKFLGDVPQRQVESVKAATQSALAGCKQFRLTAEKIGCFPRPNRPKVIWVGLEGEREPLHRLRDRIEASVSPLGYPTEDRPFSPHLTLGRVKTEDRQAAEKIGAVIRASRVGRVAEWLCSTVVVMQSQLTPKGSIYTPLAEFYLEV